jgi:hypothetical protein
MFVIAFDVVTRAFLGNRRGVTLIGGDPKGCLADVRGAR